MRHVILRITAFLAIILAAALILGAQDREPVYKGRPLSAWVQSIREHDQQMGLAFEAIKALGPRASAAVPELIRIFDQPFSGIRVGVDDDDVIAQKLCDLQFRSDLVDSLGAIGIEAAPAAGSLIAWALTPRVIAEDIKTARDYRAFIDLVTLDVLERMRVADVVARFRLDSAEPMLALLSSRVTDERKLGVAILQGHTLPLAAELMKTSNCESRKLGLALMVDLWSVVSTENLVDLKQLTACEVTTK